MIALRTFGCKLISLPLPAAAGTYNPEPGGMSDQACQRCDVGQDSAHGSAECRFCASTYYRPHADSAADQCAPCSSIVTKDGHQGVSCMSNTTLGTLALREQYWRHSSATTDLHRCKSSHGWTPCRGGVDAGKGGIGYCDNETDGGYEGPRCEVCKGEDRFFDETNARCNSCGDTTVRAVIFFATSLSIIVAVASIAAALFRAGTKHNLTIRELRRLVHSARKLWRKAGGRCKLKGLIGFCKPSRLNARYSPPTTLRPQPPLNLDLSLDVWQTNVWLQPQPFRTLLFLPGLLRNMSNGCAPSSSRQSMGSTTLSCKALVLGRITGGCGRPQSFRSYFLSLVPRAVFSGSWHVLAGGTLAGRRLAVFKRC
eukprot:7002547-Prymnesium_polylepis.1